MERQFQDFLYYVPYLDNNETVRSFRLTNILLNICGRVDSAFKEMAKYRKFYNRQSSTCREIVRIVRENKRRITRGEIPRGPGFKLCLETFEDIYNLSRKEVIFKRLPIRDQIIPFTPHNSRTRAPYWWDLYNQTKHDFHEYFKNTSLKSTRDALAGVFLLNVIHEPAILRLNEFGLLKSKFAFKTRKDILKLKLRKKQQILAVIETPLFFYDYDQ